MQIPDDAFDPERLAALAGYEILDTPAEQGFDDIVQLAVQICQAPVALVSLVAVDRQWFKARIGFDPCETDLDRSVCVHALSEPDLLVIPDLTRDARTRDNPLVTGDPHIRFYAGAPFRAASGEALGTLCVIDSRTRPEGLTPDQASGLRNLARQVTSQLQLRRAIAERDALVAEQRRAERRRTGLLVIGDRLREMTTVGDMTRAATAVAGTTLDVSRAAFGRFDDSADHLVIELDWTAPGVASIAGTHRVADFGDRAEGLLRGEPLIVGDAATDALTAAQYEAIAGIGVRSFVMMPVRRDNRTVGLFIVQDSQPQRWPPEVLTFLRNVADRLEAGIGRLEAEADQHVLNHELSHRLKNTFAMIQAIATQTLRGVPDQRPVETFIDRLAALSQAHEVLLQKNWSSASIGMVIHSVLQTLGDRTRLTISGDHLELGPRATLSLSLLLHELMTNAMKYGSLQGDEGHVTVSWHVLDIDGEAEFVLNWRETGGPRVGVPSKTGFGSKLIRMGLAGFGGVNLRYLPEGLAAELRAPLAQIRSL